MEGIIMPAESACSWTFTGPAMEPHWKRVKWNFRHLLNFKKTNPYHTKPRTAASDLGHSLVNITTEYARACPYRAGHILFWENVIILVTAIGFGVGYFVVNHAW